LQSAGINQSLGRFCVLKCKTHTRGGFYHDGRFATLNDVIDHYDSCLSLGLTAAEKSDLSQYLLSLPESNREHGHNHD
jgi:hypothetical protein